MEERLSELRMTYAELARLVGESPQTIHNWKRRGNIPADKASKVADALGIRLEWLLSGTGPMTENAHLDLAEQLASNQIRIPIYDVEVAAGAGAFTDHEPVIDSLLVRCDWLRQLVGYLPAPEHLAIIEVRGDSMEPTLSPGDLVLVERRVFARHEMADGIYVVRLDGTLLIKRVQIVPGGLRLISDNEFYQAQNVEDAEVLARVFWAWHGRRL